MSFPSSSRSVRNLVAYFSIWFSTVSAGPNVSWIYPGSNTNPYYNYKDSVVVSWESNLSDPYLAQICAPSIRLFWDYTLCSNSSVDTSGNSLTWLDTSYSANGQPFSGDSSCGPNVTCLFILYSVNNYGQTSNSTFWSITQNDKATPTTWSASSLTITKLSLSTTQKPSPVTTTMISFITQTASLNTSAVVAPIHSTSSPMPSPSSSGPSTGAAAGIGVGVTGAVASLATAAFLIYRKRRQKYFQNSDSVATLMGMQSPGGFDGKGEQQEMLPQFQQPAVGELDVNLPTISLGELDASPTIMEIGEPKSPVHEETQIREVKARVDQDSRTAAPCRIADEDSAAGAHDKTEDEEREIEESIRNGDDKRI